MAMQQQPQNNKKKRAPNQSNSKANRTEVKRSETKRNEARSCRLYTDKKYGLQL